MDAIAVESSRELETNFSSLIRNELNTHKNAFLYLNFESKIIVNTLVIFKFYSLQSIFTYKF